MNEPKKLVLNKLSTGVPDLDAVLGGGLPEYSFNIIAGSPGTGKTTLAHQIMFANATPERPALYFTILGEPTLKMLRYQQQFDFFDASKLENSVRFINLSDTVLENDLGAVLDRIKAEVEAAAPGLVFVDSFRTLIRKAQSAPASEMELQGFVQRLALYLTSWQATTFLIGEYTEGEMRDNPVFTVADSLLWLVQSVERNSVVRKLQVIKLRGQESMPGLHTFRITEKGLQVFPRTYGLIGREQKPSSQKRQSTGVPGLDEMLAGGIPLGDSVLVAGPSGSGKSALATQFLAEGIKQGAVASAGMEPPLLLRSDGQMEEMKVSGLLLGFQLNTEYSETTFQLEPGDMVILTTDGVTEARQGKQFLGYEGLMRLAQEGRSLGTLEKMGQTVLDGARAFAGGHFKDDACVLLARRQ